MGLFGNSGGSAAPTPPPPPPPPPAANPPTYASSSVQAKPGTQQKPFGGTQVATPDIVAQTQTANKKLIGE
jgi:hypothetical protein